MAFDLGTAKPVSGGFDLSTAKPLQPQGEQLPVGTEMGGVGEALTSVLNPMPVAAKAASGYAAIVTKVAEGLGIAEPGEAERLIAEWEEAAEYQPKTQAGVQKLQEFMSSPVMQYIGKVVQGVEGAVDLAGERVAQFTGSPTAATIATTPFKAAGDVAEAMGAGATVKGLQVGGKAGLRQLPQSQRKQEIGRQLATREPRAETAGYRLRDEQLRNAQDVPVWREEIDVEFSPSDQLAIENQSGITSPELTPRQLKIENYPEASRLIEQGFSKGDTASIQSLSPEDARISLQMARQKDAQLNNSEVSRRPSEIVGKALTKRVDAIKRANAKAGKELGKTLSDFQGKSLPYNETINKFLSKLADEGIQVVRDGEKVKADLSQSKFLNDSATQGAINTVFERLSQIANRDGTMNASAKDLHDLKKLIDHRVNWGASSGDNRLLIEGQNLIKGLRSDINELLSKNSKKYAAANKDYAKTISALDELDSATNSRINIKDPNLSSAKLGIELRKIMSNYASGSDLSVALKSIDDIARQYGYNDKLNLPKLALFSSILDTRFGKKSTARESLGGNMETALENAARGRTIVDFGVDAASSLNRKRKGLNDEAAMSDLIKLLKERSK